MSLKTALSVALLVGALSLPAVAAPPVFDTWRGFPTGEFGNGRYPWAGQLGDLDGDHDLDVVVSVWPLAGAIAVLSNEGDGTFASPVRYTTDLPSLDVALADIDEDGDLDAVASNTGGFYEGNSISVFLNSGAGFAPRQNYSVGAGTDLGPAGLATDDFDRDGHLDVAVARYGSFGNGNTVALLSGDGTGNFSAPVILPAGDGPYKLASGDVSGDGWPDLVVANDGLEMNVLVNDGAGGFAPPISYAASTVPWGGDAYWTIALADADNDGDLDAFYSSTRTWEPVTGRIALFRNQGDGVFETAEFIPLVERTSGCVDLAIADVDGDGWVDVMAAQYNGRAQDGWFLVKNDGAGQFLPATLHAAGMLTTVVMAGDMDGDGDDDVLTADGSSMIVTVHPNLGAGEFHQTPTYAVETISIDLDYADLDDDGDLDLLASGGRISGTQPSVLLNQGDGTFAPSDVYSFPGGLAYGRLRDLNGDNLPDLLLVSASPPYDFQTAFNQGDGTFGPYTTWTLGSCGSGHVDAVDLDGDGDRDVCVLEDGACPGVPNGGRRIFVSENRGDGTFDPPSIVVVEQSPYDIRIADLDQNGHDDIAIAHFGFIGSGNKVSVIRSNGDGTLQTPLVYTVGQGPRDLVIADLDGDGVLDLATGNTGSGAEALETMTTLRGLGDGTFTSARTYPGSYAPDLLGATGITAGDPDFDGDTDLMMTNSASNDISFYINRGDGTFDPRQPTRYGIEKSAFAARYADFTGDGIGDLAAIVQLPPLGLDSAVAIVAGTGFGPAHVPDPNSSVRALRLGLPQPSPFHDSTVLSYRISERALVRLSVHDIAGRRVRLLVDRDAEAGFHSITWDGKDEAGKPVAAGLHFVRLQVNGVSEGRKVFVVR